MHSGMFDLGQAVAMILSDETLADEFLENCVSFDTEHHFKKTDNGTLLIIIITAIHVDEPDNEDTDSTTSVRKLTFVESEYEPIMDEILSRWKQLVLDAETTRTK